MFARMRRALAALCLAASGLGAWAAPLYDLSPEVSASLADSSVKHRDAAIKALGSDISEQNADLLRKLSSGLVYFDPQSGEIYIRKDRGSDTYSKVSDGSEVQSPSGLRRSAVSTAQRKAISGFLQSFHLFSEDAAVRLKAAQDLAEPGAKTLPLETFDKLLSREQDVEVYAALKLARALALAKSGNAGRQETFEALDLLESNSSASALQAAQALESSKDPEIAKAAKSSAGYITFCQKLSDLTMTLFFGLSLGSVLVLAAVGLSITFGVMGVINMAHGELIMIGAYTVWIIQQLMPQSPGAALLLSIPGAFIVSGLMGILIERTVIRHLYGRPLETLLATFGISLILQQLVRTLFSPLNRAVASPEFMSGTLKVSTNLSFTWNRIIIILFCIAVFFIILAIMKKTRLGLEVRAVSQNRPIARALGIRAARVDALTFGLGSGVAGMAGVALSQITNVGPNLGQNYIVDSFMVVVFGGAGNLWGTLTGGLIMGVANKLLEPLSGAMLSKIIILVALILFIQKRPRGLFPQRGRAAED